VAIGAGFCMYNVAISCQDIASYVSKVQIFPAQSVFSTLIRGYPLGFNVVFGNRVPRLSCGVTYI